MTTKMVMMRGDITLKIEVEICRKYQNQTDEQIDERLIEIANDMRCCYLYLEESND